MAKFTKSINLLLELLEKKDIVLHYKSERTARQYYNNMIECLKRFGRAEMAYSRTDKCWCFVGPTVGDDLFGPCEEVMPIWDKLNDAGMFRRFHCGVETIDTYNSFKDYIASFDHDLDYLPGGKITIEGKYRGDVAYSIQFVPENVTNTPKRRAAIAWREKVKKVCETIGVLWNCPNECWWKYGYHKCTEEIYLRLSGICNEYIEGKKEIASCSPKQAIWVAKMLGCSEEAASKLNKFQASEVLDYMFDDTGMFDKEKEEIKEYYNKILK